jgi:hypothetical protein
LVDEAHNGLVLRAELGDVDDVGVRRMLVLWLWGVSSAPQLDQGFSWIHG